MYTVSSHDLPREIQEMPRSSVGAPCPMLIAGEHSLRLAYYMANRPPAWDGTTVRILSDRKADEPCALVTFKHTYAHMFGPPNDEAFAGHPLAKRGLRPYAAFEVEKSSWLRALERMNAVHPCDRAERFSHYKHYILAFHDITFECIAEGFTISIHRGSVWSVLSHAQNEA